MEVVKQGISQIPARFQRLLVLTWHLLRQPRTTVILLIVLGLVLCLGLFLPQRSGPEITESFWVTTLPPWLQGSGVLLFELGFAHLFRSIWFWLPVALLLLNSLVALADYTWPSWQRFREAPGDLEWQHPLARRVEASTRLPAAPDEFLEKLKEALQTQGFRIDKPVEGNRRLISARRRAWSWLNLPVFYGGLLLLCLGFLISRYSLQTESLTLLPFEIKASPLFNATFQLSQFDKASGTGLVMYRPEAETQTALSWQLYQPTLFQGAWVLPLAADPVLTLEAQDEEGAFRNLFSPQFDAIDPATPKLNLPLSEAQEPLYFVVSSASLVFQVTPISTAEGEAYQVQVRPNSEAAASEPITVRPGETFEVDNLSIMLSLNHAMRLIIWQDWALPIYLISLIGLVGGPLLLLLSPPWQLWLIPDIKGRGGQLYGVAEKLGFSRGTLAFVEGLLTQDNPALDLLPAEEAVGLDSSIEQV